MISAKVLVQDRTDGDPKLLRETETFAPAGYVDMWHPSAYVEARDGLFVAGWSIKWHLVSVDHGPTSPS